MSNTRCRLPLMLTIWHITKVLFAQCCAAVFSAGCCVGAVPPALAGCSSWCCCFCALVVAAAVPPSAAACVASGSSVRATTAPVRSPIASSALCPELGRRRGRSSSEVLSGSGAGSGRGGGAAAGSGAGSAGNALRLSCATREASDERAAGAIDSRGVRLEAPVHEQNNKEQSNGITRCIAPDTLTIPPDRVFSQVAECKCYL